MLDLNQEIREATNDDLKYMIENIRLQDKKEIEELNGNTVEQVLDEVTGDTKVWIVNNEIVCIFGVEPIEGHPKTGVIWLLATSNFYKYTKPFAVQCKEVFKEVISKYEYLFNYVLSENKDSVKWLKWLGFNVEDPKPIGIKGANFSRFELLNV